jgi:hypothetical protein
MRIPNFTLKWRGRRFEALNRTRTGCLIECIFRSQDVALCFPAVPLRGEENRELMATTPSKGENGEKMINAGLFEAHKLFCRFRPRVQTGASGCALSAQKWRNCGARKLCLN